MKVKVWKYALLLSVLWMTVPALAQRRNLVMYHDSVAGRDTLVTHVNFLSGDTYELQYRIKLRLKDGVEKSFRAHEIYGYRDGRRSYYSRRLEVDGRVCHVLLPRVYDADSVAVYRFIREDGKRKLYAEVGKDSLLMPFADENNPDCINPLLYAYLKEFPIAQDEVVGKYIDGVKPTVGSFERRHRVVRTANPNYITRFRWGVMLGAGMGKAVVEPYDFGNKLLGYGGLFADVPVYEGLSVRPEVTFNPYAYSSHQTSSSGETNAVYNRNDLTGTFLVRYTVRSFKGKWLPYALLGPELNMVLDKSLQSAGRWVDDEGFTVLEQQDVPQPKGMTLGVTGGAGVECTLTQRRSLFLDLRYRHELEEEGLRGICLTVSINL